jgi:acetyl esterase/lipase
MRTLTKTIDSCRRITQISTLLYLLPLCLISPLHGQVMPQREVPPPETYIDSTGIPRNRYFTLESATAKVQKQYPFAVPALPDIPTGVAVKRSVVYRTVAGRQLRMDICLPARADARVVPAVMLIHGGGWRSGDMSMELPMALQLAAHGYVAATVEYRLSPEALYPGAVLDLKAAVRWIRAHAREYGVDTLRIAAYGCSSGGHLASLLGVTNGAREYEEGEHPGCSSTIQAVVDIDGPLDLTHPEESGKDTIPSKPSAAKSWLGSRYADEPELWKKASPVTHLHRGMPPMLFVNSSLERYHVGRDAAVDTMKRCGIYYEVHTIPNTPHPFWLFKPWQPEVVKHIATFLERVFRQ